jgi:transcriptional regulator with XRE-family HTH domain
MLKKSISDQNSKRLSYLSSYLRELRLNENQTMEEQSKQMHLHKNTILRAENSHNLTLISVFKFADEFNIPVYELFQDIE